MGSDRIGLSDQTIGSDKHIVRKAGGGTAIDMNKQLTITTGKWDRDTAI